MVGRPIETRAPEGGETAAGIFEFEHSEARGLIGKAKVGREDIILFPANMATEFDGIGIELVGVDGGLQTGFAHTVYMPGEHGIKLRCFSVIDTLPAFGRGNGLLTLKLA